MTHTTELLNADNVIDRLYLKYRNSYEPFQLLQVIVDHLNTIFTAHKYDREFVKERIIKILGYQEKLHKLSQMPVVEQRSPEWYEMRQTRITASDFAQALGEGKFASQKQFYQKKCGYEMDNFDNNAAPLKWGIKYEPIAIDAYACRNQVKMVEFGLLPHPTISWFGASPDSITELGVMVEIKCPWKRKITGEVPKQYMYQMQGQLDVCDLDECDFLECEFLEYDDEEEFKRHFNDNTNEKGVIIEYAHKGNYSFLYSPFEHHANLQQTLRWKKETLENLIHEPDKTFVKAYHWQLHTFSVVRVYRDKALLKDKMSLLKQVWEKIVLYKQNKDLYEKDLNTVKVAKSAKACEEIDIDIDLLDQRHQSSKATVKNTGYAFLSDSDTD